MPEKTTAETNLTGSAQKSVSDGIRWYIGLQIIKALGLIGGILLAAHVATLIRHAGEILR